MGIQDSALVKGKTNQLPFKILSSFYGFQNQRFHEIIIFFKYERNFTNILLSLSYSLSLSLFLSFFLSPSLSFSFILAVSHTNTLSF
uniref:Uncharacterized protein n=1 Tax=Octopus bimaculoides TaxID=37653 RepID=A0A0L8I1C2_OCTBM